MLFPSDWDRRHLSNEGLRERFEIVFQGREMWRFPAGLLKMLTFDPAACINRILADIGTERFDGVVSTDAYVGGTIAAAVAQRLGLPGGDPAVMTRMQHKYESRQIQREAAPEAVPAFQLMGMPPPRRDEIDLAFPFFVKPLRGSYSIFAGRVDSYSDLRNHLNLNAFWRCGLKTALLPVNRLLRRYVPGAVDANRFIGEELLEGQQACLDGFVYDGEVRVVGIVDARMFPGTNAFERFSYPSTLPASVQQRMHGVAQRLIEGFGIRHGQFNIEMFYGGDDRVTVIEMHPRLSYQFADMFEDVDGVNTYEALLDLAIGARPTVRHRAGAFKHSASLVVRKFSGSRVRAVPPVDSVKAFIDRHPAARVLLYAKKGSMNPEMRAMGSYRCALINVGANSIDELSRIRHDADEMLRFEVA